MRFQSSNGTVGCGMGTICNKTDANVAMCDRCDFDNTTLLCGYVPGYYDLSPTTAVPRVCATGFVEILNNQYNPNLRFYNDTNLSPHTFYDYYLVAINNVGNASSSVRAESYVDGPPCRSLAASCRCNIFIRSPSHVEQTNDPERSYWGV